jgi:K(+)-stimulated pyrophosphate-energized sodium pump
MMNGVRQWLSTATGILGIALLLTVAGLCWAQEPAPGDGAAAPAAAATSANTEIIVWSVCVLGSLVALIQAFVFYKQMMASDPGNARMQEIAGYVRTGAAAYLQQQYKVVAAFFVVIAALLAIQAFWLKTQSEFVPFAFITGGFFSGLAGFFGMKTATHASSRTAAAAQKSLNQGLQVAFRSGAVMGLVVVGLGLLDICIWYAMLRWGMSAIGHEPLALGEITVIMLCFGMGASSQALFARVGGGIFTKAADVGADLVGKVEAGIPEDDPRNPATIADNVGDNVGDVAGMGADLYESYCGSILATAALGVAAFLGNEQKQLAALLLPMAIAGVGIVLSIAGMYVIRTDEEATQKNLLAALFRGINAATLLVAVCTFGLAYWILPDNMGVAGSVVVGLVAGWLIGYYTTIATSDEYSMTKEVAAQAQTGPATVIIGGIAAGMQSTWAPVVVVCIATLASFGFANGWDFASVDNFALGLYGVGIAAVGMLSTLGITLATDAYGPIADNAGGNAEMSHLGPEVRRRTDALDALGNTTAATGKGFAIGSAALTALALLAAYIEEVRVGFERWGKDPTVIATSADDGYYKINQNFVVHKNGTDPKAYEMYLLMPSESRLPAWQAMPLAKEGKSTGILTADLKGSAKRRKLTLGEDQLTLIELKHATIPDFATYYDASLMNPKAMVGILLGSMSVFVFCAMTMKAVGRAAKGMVEEVRRQFKENPGIMAGTSMPDYARPVQISTVAAQREMILPSLLGLITPVAVGLVLGVGGVLGLLVGTLATGFCVAVFMSNSGGSWDNAKKHIEAGNFGGKKTDAHKAAVVGDTVGDPFKDTSGPSLNILIKLMSMVSVVAAGLVVRYSLAALGIF